MKYIVIRDIKSDECPWLGDFKQGTIVYDYGGYTYGCISSKGEAFTMEDGKTPFFELPTNAVRPLDELPQMRKEKLEHLKDK